MDAKNISPENLMNALVYRDIYFTELDNDQLVETLVDLIKYEHCYDQYWDVANIISDIKRRLKSLR
jgi:hypothetical protein